MLVVVVAEEEGLGQKEGRRTRTIGRGTHNPGMGGPVEITQPLKVRYEARGRVTGVRRPEGGEKGVGASHFRRLEPCPIILPRRTSQ